MIANAASREHFQKWQQDRRGEQQPNKTAPGDFLCEEQARRAGRLADSQPGPCRRQNAIQVGSFRKAGQ